MFSYNKSFKVKSCKSCASSNNNGLLRHSPATTSTEDEKSSMGEETLRNSVMRYYLCLSLIWSSVESRARRGTKCVFSNMTPGRRSLNAILMHELTDPVLCLVRCRDEPMCVAYQIDRRSGTSLCWHQTTRRALLHESLVKDEMIDEYVKLPACRVSRSASAESIEESPSLDPNPTTETQRSETKAKPKTGTKMKRPVVIMIVVIASVGGILAVFGCAIYFIVNKAKGGFYGSKEGNNLIAGENQTESKKTSSKLLPKTAKSALTTGLMKKDLQKTPAGIVGSKEEKKLIAWENQTEPKKTASKSLPKTAPSALTIGLMKKDLQGPPAGRPIVGSKEGEKLIAMKTQTQPLKTASKLSTKTAPNAPTTDLVKKNSIKAQKGPVGPKEGEVLILVENQKQPEKTVSNISAKGKRSKSKGRHKKKKEKFASPELLKPDKKSTAKDRRGLFKNFMMFKTKA